MYAKLFKSLYHGTLRGKSHAILVFTNMLANADMDGFVDMHFQAIADEVGLTAAEVREAVLLLEAPDPESRTPTEEGRRILRMSDHRKWGWKIVNIGVYRAIRNADDRREQNRQAQIRRREKLAREEQEKSARRLTAADGQQKSAESAHVDVDVDVDIKKPPPSSKVAPLASSAPSAPPADAKPPAPPPPPPDDEVQLATRPDDVSAQVWADFLTHRKAKRAPVTATVLKRARIEAAKVLTAGIPLEPFLELWCARGSQGLMGKWVRAEELDALGVDPADAPRERKSFRQIDIEAKRARWEEMTGRKWGDDGDGGGAPLQLVERS